MSSLLQQRIRGTLWKLSVEESTFHALLPQDLFIIHGDHFSYPCIVCEKSLPNGTYAIGGLYTRDECENAVLCQSCLERLSKILPRLQALNAEGI